MVVGGITEAVRLPLVHGHLTPVVLHRIPIEGAGELVREILFKVLMVLGLAAVDKHLALVLVTPLHGVVDLNHASSWGLVVDVDDVGVVLPFAGLDEQLVLDVLYKF